MRITRILPSVGNSSEARFLKNYYDIENEDDFVVSESVNENFLIYPNPSECILYIKASNDPNEIFNVEIFNMLGQRVLSINNVSLVNKELDVRMLARGTYIIKVNNKNKAVQKTIVIK